MSFHFGLPTSPQRRLFEILCLHVLLLHSLHRLPVRVVPWACLCLKGARERLGQAQGLADGFTGAVVECFTSCRETGTCCRASAFWPHLWSCGFQGPVGWTESQGTQTVREPRSCALGLEGHPVPCTRASRGALCAISDAVVSARPTPAALGAFRTLSKGPKGSRVGSV